MPNTTRWGTKEIVYVKLLLVAARVFSLILSNTIFPAGSEISSFIRSMFFASGRLFAIPVILYYTIILYQAHPSHLGLKVKGTLSTFRFAWRAGFLVSLFFLCALNIPQSLGYRAFGFTPLLEVDSFSLFADSLPYYLALSMVYLFPVFAEELYYRGFLFDFLRRKSGTLLGGLVNALLFSLMQPGLSWPAWGGHFLVGLFCSVITEHSGSILPPVLFRTMLKSSLILYVTGWGL